MVNQAVVAATRPSDERRRSFNRVLSVPIVSNFFPIERYYDAAQTTYESFQEICNDPTKLKEAYVYGKRYCAFCVEAIPTHNYYRAPKYAHLASKHAKQVDKVLTQLGVIIDRMDEEELRLQKQRAEQQRRECEEHERRERKRFEELQQRVHRQQLFSNQSKPGESVEASAMSKLERLRADLQAKQEGTERVNSSAGVGQPRIRRDPSGEEPIGVPSSRYHLPSDEEEDGLPPPLPPPLPNGSSGPSAPPPPSYDSILSTQRNGRYRPEALVSQTIGFADVRQEQPGPVKRAEQQPMRKLQEMYRDDYHRYQQAGSIRVQPLGTYQGRLSSSTNGCTVISALVAAKHLSSRPTAISDGEINEIIDRVCGPILRKIRGKLGLGDHALIIPSDVHDFLVDEKILHQEYFVGAAGGNVMDQKHMGEFLKLLVYGEDGKTQHQKAAATLFFREHVISIVKTPIGNAQSQFELVDSLPGSSGRGSRTCCKDMASLQVLLRWYTSRKFSPSDCSYIDKNDWTDAMADIDPRVFQGFVWAVK